MDAAAVKATKTFQRTFPNGDNYPANFIATLAAMIIGISSNNLGKAQETLQVLSSIFQDLDTPRLAPNFGGQADRT